MKNKSQVYVALVMTILGVSISSLPILYPRPGTINPLYFQLDYYLWLLQQPGGIAKFATVMTVAIMLVAAVIAYDMFRIKE